MRALELSRVRCMPCGEVQDASRWGSACAECGWKIFRVELDRSETMIDLDNLVDRLFNPFRDRGFLDEETSCGSPSPRPERRDVSSCSEVSADEISAFLASTGEARRDLYIGWKRRDLEAMRFETLQECGRCRLSFKAYANEWNKAGFCSKACFHVHLKSSRKPG
jgi:hypothetical protein